MNKRKIKKGFSFKPTTEYIKETMDMPARFKLDWLEEIKEFTFKAVRGERRKIWEKFRRGEI